jgi:hypothetical protein
MAESRSRFGALKTFRQGAETEPVGTGEIAAPVQNVSLTETGKGRGRPTGKRSNPDYEPTTVLLRKKTKRSASRLLEDIEANKDLSELIESLLNDWISRHS